MRLYDPNSSIQARQALVKFAKTTLLNNRLIEVLVDGPSGDRCTALQRNGKLKNVPCESASFFVCEYKEATTTITCDENHLIVVSGSNLPVICSYSGAISNGNTAIVSKSDIEKESILTLQVFNNENAFHIPIDIASNFPNLQSIFFVDCSISEISYNSLKDLSRLTFLDLSFNNISKLDRKIFKDLVNLKWLAMGKL
jgi:hypothetical protein